MTQQTLAKKDLKPDLRPKSRLNLNHFGYARDLLIFASYEVYHMAAPLSLHPQHIASEKSHIANPIQHHFGSIINDVDPAFFYSKGELMQLLQNYTERELAALLEDFIDIQDLTFSMVDRTREYLFSVGAASKSAFLKRIQTADTEIMMKEEIAGYMTEGYEALDSILPKIQVKSMHLEEKQQSRTVRYAWIDPKFSVLLRMDSTYKASKDPHNSTQYWENGAIFISLILLAQALKEGYAIADGSSLITPKHCRALQNNYHYTVMMLHLTNNNDHGSLQDLPEFLNAGVNRFLFFYQKDQGCPIHAGEIFDSQMVVINAEAYDNIQSLHDNDCGPNFFHGEIDKATYWLEDSIEIERTKKPV